jgi:hypothetical protein
MDEASAALFGGSYKVKRDASFDSATQAILGRTLTDAEVGEMIGAMGGARIETVTDGDGPEAQISFVVRHPSLMSASERTLFRNTKGEVELRLDYLALKPDVRGGVGARIMAREIQGAEKAGVQKVSLIAAGGPGAELNGYYTWPRLGFNAPIPTIQRPGYMGAKDMHDLFSRPGGAELWKQHGYQMEMSFDPRRGSPHRQIFDGYIQQKGIRVG